MAQKEQPDRYGWETTSPEVEPEPAEADRATLKARATVAARLEVKEAVEEWFVNVSLDDLFRVKGWSS